MDKGKLYFLIAPPRAGKTTFCRDWLSYKECSLVINSHPIRFSLEHNKITPRVIISGDEFRKAVHGHAYIKEAEELVFANMTTACRALINTGFDVMVDETNSTLTSIYRLLLVDIDAIPLWIDTPENVCVKRARDTNKKYLIPPIKRICKQIEELRAGWPDNFNKLRQQIIERKTSDQVAV